MLRSEGTDTLKCCIVLARRAVASAHWVSTELLSCFCIAPTTPRSVGVMQQQSPYKPNGAMQQYNRAAQRWLLRRWECVPSLKRKIPTTQICDDGDEPPPSPPQPVGHH